MKRDELQRIARLEREPSGEQPVEDHTERVDVRGGGRGLPERLLRRDVRRGAEKCARLGERPFPRRHACEPEVGEFRPALLVEEHVCRLEIAMHDTASVGVREACGDARGDVERLVVRQRLSRPQPVLERAAGQILEHDVRTPIGVAVVVEVRDVRVCE